LINAAVIPVANIYYLLCYAWNEFAPRELTFLASEQFSDTLHLFSRLLAAGVRTLYRRGLETGYLLREEMTSTMRGHILIGDTLLVLAKQPKKLFCTFDELSADIANNQILKATMKSLLGEDSLKRELRTELSRSLALLSGVSETTLNARLFYQVRLHQNNRLYSFLINICRFFYESLEAQEQPGRYRFRDVDRDKKRMRRVFENFVRNFFARRQQTFEVKSERSGWLAAALEGSDLRLLPRIETDATLRSQDRTIVIECKYTESLYQKRFFADKLRSAHLYQLCAYLRNLAGGSEADRRAEGILLYPTAGIELDQSYQLHGHRVRVKTLDLNQRWTAIEQEMLGLIRPVI
jgi:5-methylcytosine-specific restriction enzyme subunit McrC